MLLLMLLAATPAAAQLQTTQIPAVTEQDIDSLLTTLEDPAAREKLIRQLRALKAAQAREAEAAEPEGIGAVLLSSLSEQVQQVSGALIATAGTVLDLPELISRAADDMADPEVRGRWLDLVLKVGIVLILALAAEGLASRLLRRPLHQLEIRNVSRYWLRIPFAVARLLLELLPVIAFVAVAYSVLPATKPGEVTGLVALTLINAHAVVRAIGAVVRTLISPGAPGLRLIPTDDETANYVVIWMRRLTVISAYGYFLAQAALVLGISAGIYSLLLRVIGLIVTVFLVVLVLQNRSLVRDWLRSDGDSAAWARFRDRAAEVWHFLAIGYVLAAYVVWALEIAGGFQFLLRATVLTVVVFVLVRILSSALRRVVSRGFALSAELKVRFPGLEERVNRYLPFFETLLRGAIYFFFGIALLEIWGIRAFDWLTSDIGRRAFASLVTIVIILVVATMLSEFVNEVIERYIRRRQSQWQDAERHARLRTLLPLLRTAFRVLLVVMVALIVLSELGLNIAPLLAGAGVVGLAIGFGAQTLVKDVINGIFILIEDTIAIGDIVDVDGHAGVVEAMTIRSIRLRDFSGAVHTVPFSAVATVKNLTKDFSYYVFDVGVSYREDVDRVMAVLREIGAEMQADEAYRRSILEPIEVVGLDQFGDSAVVIRGRIKTRPIKQWEVGREFNRRMKRAFDEKGIEIPFPQRTIHHRWDAPPPQDAPPGVRQLTADG
jgi:small conductance mechanosensitive channel